MDRTTWLREVRRETKEEYTRLAPLYGEKYGLHISATHQQFIVAFLDLFPPGSLTLDAACGAGKYLPDLLERGHTITGTDQSPGMLARARENYPEVQFEKVGLQEMVYQEVFHGAICMDAMEHVCPEDWPPVLSNFYRALKQQGYLYFTVEPADEEDVRQAFKRAQQAGLPVVYGEWPDESVYQTVYGTGTLSVLASYSPDNLVGPAHEATVILAKTEDLDSETPVEEDNWIAALEWAEQLGADIVLSSLGYIDWYDFADLDGQSTLITTAAEMAAARGVLVVNAVGDQRANPSWPHLVPPADGRNVLAVGSIDLYNQVSFLSSPGPTAETSTTISV